MSLSQCHIRFLADNKSYESTSNRCGFVQKKKANISAFLVTRILTPMKALSSGVGWGGATTLMFTCTHRIGYIMISSVTLAHTHTHLMLRYMLYYIYIYVWLTLVLPQLFSQRAVLASVVRPFTASNALPFIRWLCHGRWVRAANLPNRIQTCQTCVAHSCSRSSFLNELFWHL